MPNSMSCLPIIVVATVLVHPEEMTGTTGKYHNNLCTLTLS
ncbi:hypothetical protein [Coxiella-like endosymbiont of Rhipicephalus sanguineus]|nr:hypothetical protein [Coxiella-like endosymbiont of Rhipicephalus sanguineus]